MTFRGWPLLVAVMMGCEGRDLHVQAILQLPGDSAAGEELFDEQCATCHEGYKPGLESSDERVVEQILYGGSSTVYAYMPPFVDTLSDQQVADLFAWLRDTSM